LVISNNNSFRVLFDKNAFIYLLEKYMYILALEMASRGNQHCASCIGTLSFPIWACTRLCAHTRVSTRSVDVPLWHPSARLKQTLHDCSLKLSYSAYSERSRGSCLCNHSQCRAKTVNVIKVSVDRNVMNPGNPSFLVPGSAAAGGETRLFSRQVVHLSPSVRPVCRSLMSR